MDRLFLQYGKRNIVITSDGLPDRTGTIRTGTKDMMITTLSKISEKSGAFNFIDIEQGGAVDFIQSNVNKGFALPDYYVRGAITQVDRNVASDSKSVGVALPFASLGYSDDQLLSVVTIDMSVGDLVKRQIIPGLHTTNTITIVGTGQGVDAEGIIKKASLFFEISQDRNQGTHQSVRTLVELGLIELLGKLTKVPYWRCLEIESTNPTAISQARDWYDEIPETKRIYVVQRAMFDAGLYNGQVDGWLNPHFREALNQYKAKSDLIANGRVDFDLYYRLMIDNHVVKPEDDGDTGNDQALTVRPKQASLSNEPNKQSSLSESHKPKQKKAKPRPSNASGRGGDHIGLSLEPSGGIGRKYELGDKLAFTVSVQQPANIYCYYEYVDDNKYYVVRVFPNRWQKNARVTPAKAISFPENEKQFSIELAQVGEEESVACVATDRAYSRQKEPLVLSEPDLVPLKKARRLYGIIDQHLEADRFNSSVQHVRWAVR